MKSNYLLPNTYKILGWILLIIGIVVGVFIVASEYDSDILTVNVLSIYNSDSIIETNGGFFSIIENSILDELVALSIIFGGLLVGFSKEKVEDEFIQKLRTDSLKWAIIVNYVILVFTIIFVFGFDFFDVLVFNMFTPILFYIFRFNFLKMRS